MMKGLKPLKFGIIGVSEGNGHPYSWSAICNGYDKAAMSKCPYPAIYEYLEAQSWPEDSIGHAAVTHIYTQDESLSKDIASAAKIPHIVKSYQDMANEVDAILLARDDYQNHSKFASYFLEKGLPVYIDKPLANTVEEARNLLSLQQYEGQIFSCSALRYMNTLAPFRERLGEITAIKTAVPKYWSTYSVHIIEPILSLFPNIDISDLQLLDKKVDGEKVSLSLMCRGKRLAFSSSGKADGEFSYTFTFKDGNEVCIPYGDTFNSFKSAILEFIAAIKEKRPVIPRTETLAIMRVIEAGKSKK